MTDLIQELEAAREAERVRGNEWVAISSSSPMYDERLKAFKKAQERTNLLRYRIQLEANGLINRAAVLLAALDK